MIRADRSLQVFAEGLARERGLPVKKRHKYGARRVQREERADGLAFDSQAEAKHYDTLRLMAAAGEIADLVVKPKFALVVKGVEEVKVGVYTADFAYTSTADGKAHVVDVKGVVTREFKRTALLMRALYGIDVEVVGDGRGRKNAGGGGRRRS